MAPRNRRKSRERVGESEMAIKEEEEKLANTEYSKERERQAKNVSVYVYSENKERILLKEHIL